MRLIDADALSKEFDKRCYGDCCCCIENTNTESGCKIIDEAPIVNAVPLDKIINVSFFDEEHEEWSNKDMTVREYLLSRLIDVDALIVDHGMKKFLVLSNCSPEYNRIVEAEDISEVADHYYDSCYGIIEISQDEVTECAELMSF